MRVVIDIFSNLKIILISLIFISFCSCATVDRENEGKIQPDSLDTEVPELDFSHSSSRSGFLKDLQGEKTKDVDMLFKIANSFYDSGNYNEARKLYLDILRIKPDYANRAACHFNLGLISMKQNDWKESAARFRYAAKIFVKVEDIRDSRLLLMENLRNDGSWEEVVNESDAFLKDPGLSGKLDVE
ncbi:MAG TPA: tetratricopeptide repeat protein, partial [bacterium]|nr:tetratricopeptide repeat protein [bacterium]